MKNKVVIVIVLFIVLVCALAIYFAFRAGKLSGLADVINRQKPPGSQNTVSTPKNLDEIAPTALYAGACNPGSFECFFTKTSPIGRITVNTEGIVTEIIRSIGFKFGGCSNQFLDEYKKNQKTPLELTNYAGTSCIADVSFMNKTDKGDQIKVIFTTTRSGNISSEFPTIYKTATISNSGKETINQGAYSAKATEEYQYYRKADNSLELISHTINEKRPLTFTGNVDTSFTMTLNGKEDLLTNYLDLHNNEYILSPSSIWRATTSGTVNGAIAGSWSADNLIRDFKTNLTKFDFCPNGCEMKMREELNVKAQKKSTPQDGVSGTLESFADHQETYLGFGKGNLTTGKVAWTDLKVDKTDKRHWKQNLTYGSIGPVSLYEGYINSEAHLQPLINKSTVTSQEDKGLSVKNIPINKTDAPNGTQEFQLVLHKREKSVDGKRETSGTGFRISCIKGINMSNCVNTEGVFDNKDTKMFVTYPESSKGQRYDLFGGTDSYTKTYFLPGTLYVPNLFTASYGNADTTTISSRPIKLLPKKLYVLLSYSEENKDDFKSDVEKVRSLTSDLKNRGVDVVELRVQKKSEMISDFAQMENGSWVLNIGHGTPVALYAGEELVAFSDIDKTLKDKQVRLDVLAAGSCYSGRSALAQVVIGSMGIAKGSSKNYSQSDTSNTLLGIGANAWSYTIEDILNILQGSIQKK